MTTEVHDPNNASVGFCPVCRQGRQVIASECSTGNLFVYCEECESEWDSPLQCQDVFLAHRDRFGTCTFLTSEELREHAWFEYVMNPDS